MSCVNLDDVYVNKSGDSIAGNLSVGGALTINDAKGTGGTYNVANEITTLHDSVSQSVHMLLYDSETYGRVVFYSRGCVATLTVLGVAGVNVASPWKIPDTIPTRFKPDEPFYNPLVHRQSNNVGQIWIPGKRTDDPYFYIYAGVAPSGNNNSLNGTVSWIYTEPDDLES